ncbi:F-box domain protein [Colletotrichum scovillei]|uniref:F-box domain protein n=1 Tax=Colletotrichum scovillei TaxID=1209932 RepID=A0A9P7R970_9PEZI|nr:F-box domain protein [Colletotrichum scovillei]KAG7071463.1 F-box domain protein [Colletotrichum scovillei]KAG7079713.1 F-box domain protein [Colletotrichum scovillei]
MSLLHLPVEVLQTIILETIPQSIDNVALTCKKLYEASERYLVQHNILKRRFRHFAFDVVGPDDDEKIYGTETFVVNSLDLLMKITHNPIIAQYIQIADLKIAFGNVQYHSGDISHLPPLTRDEDIKALREFLHGSPYLKEIGQDPDFWESMIRHEALGHAKFFSSAC